VAVTDVLLINRGALYGRQDAAAEEPPLSRAFEVAPGLQLAGVRSHIANAIFHVCKFRDLDRFEDAALYGFVRYEPPGTRWDEDGLMSKALFLSHFVHPHSGGFEFSARIETDDRSRLTRLEPADTATPFARAYCCTDVQRPWLTQDDAVELRTLMAAYDAARPALANTKVGLAISLFSESPFVYHGRPRATSLAIVLEALVNRSTVRAVKQFTSRIPALATDVGLPQFNRRWAEQIYGLRSRLAHGVRILSSVDDTGHAEGIHGLNTAMTEMDELLRRILNRALTDATFRDRVENIENHIPVPGGGCPTCRAADHNFVPVRCPACNTAWEAQPAPAGA
jgi:hypothetical protein